MNHLVPGAFRYADLALVPVQFVALDRIYGGGYGQQSPLVQLLMEEFALGELIQRPGLLLGFAAHRFLHTTMLSRTGTRPYLPICWELFPL